MLPRLYIALVLNLLLVLVDPSIAGYCNATCQEDAEKFYIDSIKAKLLRELHLRGPINVAAPNISPGALEELMADSGEAGTSNRVVLFSKPCNIEVPDCVSFELSQGTLSIATSARLRVFVDLSVATMFEAEQDLPSTIPVDLKVSYVYADGQVDPNPLVTERIGMEASQRVEMAIDVAELKKWKEQDIVGMTVVASYEAGDSWVVDGVVKPSVSAKVNADVIPSMILETEQPKKRNRRQGDLYCPAESTEKGCCLRDMEINFDKLGWKFILAPRRYNAYMCRGECGLTQHHMLRFGHSKIVNDAKMDNGQHCCYPSEYESLRVIYTRADNEVIITRVPGMIAKRCACT